MNAATAFSNRQEQLLAQLHESQSMDEAISACMLSLEQVACELAQDEQDELARQRQQAVLACVRRAPQLLGSTLARGELVLTQQGTPKAETAQDKLAKAAKIGGVFLLGALAVVELVDGDTLYALLQLLGANLLILSEKKKPQNAARLEARGIPYADADALVRSLRELCQAVDICVGDLILLEKDAGLARLSGTADDAMLDLLTALMEAKASGRDELAMRSLSQAEQYLHMLGVEVIPYSEDHAQLFDILPTMGAARTIRPALQKDGKILRRGVAALQAGRSVGA
ncbi:MAG: hypothetical protein IJ418_05070 [Clostridia bacterium]|nr:hypothetical protein [Clostridia bacterium]